MNFIKNIISSYNKPSTTDIQNGEDDSEKNYNSNKTQTENVEIGNVAIDSLTIVPICNNLITKKDVIPKVSENNKHVKNNLTDSDEANQKSHPISKIAIKEIIDLTDSIEFVSDINGTDITFEYKIKIEHVTVKNEIDEVNFKDEISDNTNISKSYYTNAMENKPNSTETAKVSERIGDEISKKYLKELDDALEKLKGTVSEGKVTLDDIDVILNLEEYEDANSLKKINYFPNDLDSNVNSNIDLENILAKEVSIDSIDVISISSDDTITDDIKIEDKNIKHENNPDKKDKNTKLEDKSEIISMSTTNEDDSDYNSSDFEFITEEEAKLDGFIINFDAKRRNLGVNPFNDEINDNMESGEDKHVPNGDDYLKLFEVTNQLATSQIRFLENKSLIPRTPMFVQYEDIGFNINLDDDCCEEEYRTEAKETLKKIYEMYPQNRIVETRSRRMVKRRRRF